MRVPDDPNGSPISSEATGEADRAAFLADAWQVAFDLDRRSTSLDDRYELAQVVWERLNSYIARHGETVPVVRNRKAWLEFVARNERTDLMRRRGRQAIPMSEVPDMASSDPGIEGLVVNREAVRRVFDTLARQDADLLWNCAALGYPASEVAEKLGVTRQAISKRLQRIVQRIAKDLAIIDGPGEQDRDGMIGPSSRIVREHHPPLRSSRLP